MKVRGVTLCDSHLSSQPAFSSCTPALHMYVSRVPPCLLHLHMRQAHETICAVVSSAVIVSCLHTKTINTHRGRAGSAFQWWILMLSALLAIGSYIAW